MEDYSWSIKRLPEKNVPQLQIDQAMLADQFFF